MKYCTKYGHQNNDAESFCINCGTPFGVEETTDGSQAKNVQANSKNMADNIISGVKKTTVQVIEKVNHEINKAAKQQRDIDKEIICQDISKKNTDNIEFI